jgi:hypothetical protein
MKNTKSHIIDLLNVIVRIFLCHIIRKGMKSSSGNASGIFKISIVMTEEIGENTINPQRIRRNLLLKSIGCILNSMNELIIYFLIAAFIMIKA